MTPPKPQPALAVFRLVRRHDSQPVYAFRIVEMDHFRDGDQPSLPKFRDHALRIVGKANPITVAYAGEAWTRLTQVFENYATQRDKMFKISNDVFVGGISHPATHEFCEDLMYAILRHTAPQLFDVPNNDLPNKPAYDLLADLNREEDQMTSPPTTSEQSSQTSINEPPSLPNVDPRKNVELLNAILRFSACEWIAIGPILAKYEYDLVGDELHIWIVDTDLTSPDGLWHAIMCNGEIEGKMSRTAAMADLQAAAAAGRWIPVTDGGDTASSMMTASMGSVSTVSVGEFPLADGFHMKGLPF